MLGPLGPPGRLGPQVHEPAPLGRLPAELVEARGDRRLVGGREVLPHHRVPQHRRGPVGELQPRHERAGVLPEHPGRSGSGQPERGAEPLDLAEIELDDPLGLLRGKVRASLDSAQRWERGKAAPARRAWFGIPSVPDTSRLTSAAGERSFHLARNVTRERSAAAFDDYATGKIGDANAEPELAAAERPEAHG